MDYENNIEIDTGNFVLEFSHVIKLYRVKTRDVFKM